ncbi:uncharacterized protein LOC113095135 [Carassius auratus]|uniref:Uncharacterized protein LOC113095135 n=1 Tax=Carassius auratus TaxID=7957 RepID=A0A6P6P6C6_CARAU|nr:uncharacterized protein LOC113095135 [Carassius auratus]
MSEALFLTFQSQLSLVMETVLKSAMFEITRLVEDSFLKEVGNRKQELEVLKRRLQLSESKLRERREREREREQEQERGRKTRCPDCGRTGESSRDESQPVETVRGLSLRDQSTNQPTLPVDVWSARQTPGDFLQRILANSVIHNESTSDFKPTVSNVDKSAKDFTLCKETDSNTSRLLQSASAQDAHEDLPSSSPNRKVKTETELDLLPVKEEEEMVLVWDSGQQR